MIGKKMPAVWGSGRGEVRGATSGCIVPHLHATSQVHPTNPHACHLLQVTVDPHLVSGQGKGTAR